MAIRNVAGPKLRKWYGEGELPTDADRAIVERMPEPEDIKEEKVVQDAILVTDADSATGEQVVLQLILSRYCTCNVQAICTPRDGSIGILTCTPNASCTLTACEITLCGVGYR